VSGGAHAVGCCCIVGEDFKIRRVRCGGEGDDGGDNISWYIRHIQAEDTPGVPGSNTVFYPEPVFHDQDSAKVILRLCIRIAVHLPGARSRTLYLPDYRTQHQVLPFVKKNAWAGPAIGNKYSAGPARWAPVKWGGSLN